MDFKLSKYCIIIDESENSVILYHSVTGGIINLEKNIYEKLCGTSCTPDVPHFETLKNQHYIVPEQQDEFRLLKLRELEERNKSTGALSYIIAPTTACNLSCDYCFENGFRNPYKMNSETISGIVDFIVGESRKAKNTRAVKVTWFGGEPLLCLDEILILGEQLKIRLTESDIKFTSGIVTNGILLTKEKVLKLKEKCNLYEAQITIDGLKEDYCRIKHATSQDYDHLLKNICDIYKDIKVNIRLNTNKTNLAAMYSVADMLYGKLGLGKQLNLYLAPIRDYDGCNLTDNDCFAFEEFENIKAEFYKYIFNKGYIDDLNKLEELPPFYKFAFCGLSRVNNFVIGPQGELYKCEHYFGHQDKIIGDIFNGVYYNDYYFEQFGGIKNDTCQKCNLYPICQCRCDVLLSLIKIKEGKCSHYNDLYTSLKKNVMRYIEKNENS